LLDNRIQEIKAIGLSRFLRKIPYFFYKKYRTFIITQRKQRYVLDIHFPQTKQKENTLGLLELPHDMPEELSHFLKEKARQNKARCFFANSKTIDLEKDCLGRWDVDPTTQKPWPACTPFENIDYTACGNLRYVWEIGRLQHLITYTQVYHLTKLPLWLDAIKTDLTSFFTQAPFEIGIQWRDGLQIAIRLINFIFIQDFCFEKDNDLSKMLETLIAAHITTLKTQLSPRSVVNNNHVIGELSALIIADLYLKKCPAKHLKRLEIELSEQIYSDGIPYEGSVPYIRFILEFLLLILHTMQKREIDPPSYLIEKTKTIAIALNQLSDEENRIPPLGDGDNGQVLKLTNEPYLTVTSLLKFAENTLSLKFKKSPFAHFSQAGLFHYQYQKLNIWIDAGPTGLGKNGRGGHGHNDTTSLIVHYDDCGILHDPGWYSYFINLKKRNAYRGSQAHNLLTINQMEQARLGGKFEIFPDIEHPFLRIRKNKKGVIFIYCGHDGYNRLKEKPTLSRFICIAEKQDRITITIVDKVHAQAPVLVQSHLGSDCAWEEKTKNTYHMQQHEKKIILFLNEHQDNLQYFTKNFSRETGLEQPGHGFKWDILSRKNNFYRCVWSLSIEI
jgi:hypothetical protein